MNIVTLEGADYTGKTSTFLELSKKYQKDDDIIFNEGPIYQNELTSRLLSISSQANKADTEFLYTVLYMLDKIEYDRNYQSDNRTVIQDRYWPSVIAYGNFLNGEDSIHKDTDFKDFFLSPDATIRLKCSNEEKIRRSKGRKRNSTIDSFIMEDPERIYRLNKEIDKALGGLPNLYEIDTTDKTIEEVSEEVDKYMQDLEFITENGYSNSE